MTATLGRLESIPLRQVWPLEATDFTPWLAEAENLALLADTLKLGDLQLQGTEVKVGNFNLDILARDIEGHVVVVENQFGPPIIRISARSLLTSRVRKGARRLSGSPRRSVRNIARRSIG